MITDPEATNTRIGVSGKMAARQQSTIGAYRQQMVERLFSAMLSERLDEIAQQPNAPFLTAQTDRGLFVRTEEATTLDALVPAGGVERGLAALFTEVDRVARFGFTATELNRQKLNLQRYLADGGRSRRTRAPPARSPTSSSATSSTASRFRASSTSTD